MEQKAWPIAIMMCFLVVVVGSCSRGGRVVDRVGGAEWSRDGQALYYAKYDAHRNGYYICRYDVRSCRKTTYPEMQGPEMLGFRMSPDERKILLRDDQEIHIGDLQTGRTRKVYSSKLSIYSSYWPQSDTIVFWEYSRNKDSGIFLLNPTSGSTKRFASGGSLSFAAHDGSGFLYTDKSDRYRYHNLRDGTDKLLPPQVSAGDIDFLYLDAHKLIYNVWPRDYQYTEILDLRTMRTRRITLPGAYPEMRLSPDLRRYWRTTGPVHSEWESTSLFVVDVPPKVVEQLKAPVK